MIRLVVSLLLAGAFGPAALAQDLPLADAPDDDVLVVALGGEADPTVTVPVGVPVTLQLVHVQGKASGFAGRGGPEGLVVHPDGTVTYTAPPEHLGKSWDVEVRIEGGLTRAAFVVVVAAAPPDGPATAVMGDLRQDPRTEDRRRSGRGARALMQIYGGALGAWVGGSVGYAVGGTSGDPLQANAASIPSGVLLGSGIGWGTAFMIQQLTPDYAPTPERALLMSSASTVGAFTGVSAALAIIPVGAEDDSSRIALAGALGSIAGGGLGVVVKPPPAKVTLATDLGMFVGWQAAGGVSDLVGWRFPEDRAARAGLALAGAYGVGFTTGAMRLAGVPAPTWSLMTLGLVEGAWIGAWTPLLVTRNPDASQVLGGLRLGLASGFVLAQALAPLGGPDGRTLALQSVGFASGTALGAGIPLATGADPGNSDADTRAVVAPMLGGGLAGLVAGAAMAPSYELSDDDIALVTTLGVWTTYQAIGWGFLGYQISDSPTVSTGYALTAGGASTAIATALAPLIEVSVPESALIASAGGWGTWYGAWTGHLTGMSGDAHWGTTLGAGNAALLITAALAAGPVQADWYDVAAIDGLGALGGATGAAVGVIASPELDTIAAASLIGTTLGLAGGLYLAARPSGQPMVATHLPRLLPLHLPVQARVAAHPWVDDAGKPGVWVDLNVVEVR